MNDSELLRQIRQREPEAFDLLFERYLPSVWRLVLTRVDRDTHLAEDLVNETMLALLRYLENDGNVEIESLGGWLHTVAIRKVQDHYRAVARVRHLVEAKGKQDTGAAMSSVDPGHDQAVREHQQEIRRVMESLSDQYRMALEWKYIEGLSVAAIAERMGATEKATESILFRARKAFRERATVCDLSPASGSSSGDARSAGGGACNDRSSSMKLGRHGLCGGQAE